MHNYNIITILILLVTLCSVQAEAQDLDMLQLPGRIVYERQFETYTELVYRTSEARHSYRIEQEECYRIFTERSGIRLANNYLVIFSCDSHENNRLLDMSNGHIILEFEWLETWDYMLPYVDDSGIIMKRFDGSYDLLHLDGTITFSFSYIVPATNIVYGVPHCGGPMGMACETFISLMQEDFPEFDRFYPYHRSGNSPWIILAACIGENGELNHWRSCSFDSQRSVVYDVVNSQIILTLDHASIYNGDYPPVNMQAYTQAFQWSDDGRLLVYIGDWEGYLSVYDAVEDEYIYQLIVDDIPQLIVTWFWWSPDNQKVAMMFGHLIPEKYIAVFDLATGIIDIANNLYMVDDWQLYWAFDNAAVAWIETEEGSSENALYIYAHEVDQDFVIDNNVSEIVGY